MKAGIGGLPNVGKSTLFNCLTNSKAQSANFPFCTIEPNVGVVNIPDTRLNRIVQLIEPEKVVPNNFITKAKYSPFIDMNLKGDIYMTIVNGQIGYYENKIKQTKGIELDYC